MTSFVTLAKTDLNVKNFLYLEVQKIFGIGSFFAFFCCKILGLTIKIRLYELETEEIESLDFFLHNFFILGIDLQKKNFLIRKRHLDLKTFKGLTYRLKQQHSQ